MPGTPNIAPETNERLAITVRSPRNLLNYIRSNWFVDLIQIAATVGAGYWLFHLPVPGYAIGVLSVLAAVMSVQPNVGKWQKFVWMLLLGAFLVIELHAIALDRANFASDEKMRTDQERLNFQRIADNINAAVVASRQQFADTMTRTNQVLTNITGGDSYAVVVPEFSMTHGSEVVVGIENHGKNILTGVTVTFFSQGAYTPGSSAPIFNGIQNRVSVGTLHRGEYRILGTTIYPERSMSLDDGGNKHGKYRVFVSTSAQNFTVTEYLDFEHQNGIWRFKYAVYKPNYGKEDKLLETLDWSAQRFGVKPKKY